MHCQDIVPIESAIGRSYICVGVAEHECEDARQWFAYIHGHSDTGKWTRAGLVWPLCILGTH